MATIGAAPAAFDRAVAQLRTAVFRSELSVREIPAPERIAPESFAIAADVRLGSETSEGDSPYGAGRFILMHDPELAADWGGPFRIVCFAQAPLEIEIGLDPFLADVAWSWLVDALESRGAELTFASGTATKTLSTGFGALESEGDGAQIELRASWTPLGTDFAAHAEAWGELLTMLAGLPHQEGVASLDAMRLSARHPGSRAGRPHPVPRVD
ncbi:MULTISPECIES: DUF3000 domain-containing protein [unclassified Leucobacter]|uniref:DUF3000 domain-containing protein n=1 Tax=unclassified Leucobacter TaxID=2621730 RepID=UPI00165E2D46|nr:MULTISPECIES: DUF3000 domain-containing protein [unclassified Leucobacter]MBC9926732.1 DUF3000 domain-containing protein [Leucobacter sp. cx-169]